MVLFLEPYSFGLYSYSEVFFLIYIVKFLVMIFSYNHLLQPITAFCFGETLFYFLIADTFRLLTLSYFSPYQPLFYILFLLYLYYQIH